MAAFCPRSSAERGQGQAARVVSQDVAKDTAQHSSWSLAELSGRHECQLGQAARLFTKSSIVVLQSVYGKEGRSRDEMAKLLGGSAWAIL